MGQIQVICVGMGLKAISHVAQRASMRLRRRRYVGAEINEQIVIDHRSRTFPELGPRSARALTQFPHLQKASGKAFAAAVPRNNADDHLAWSISKAHS